MLWFCRAGLTPRLCPKTTDREAPGWETGLGGLGLDPWLLRAAENTLEARGTRAALSTESVVKEQLTCTPRGHAQCVKCAAHVGAALWPQRWR